MGIIFVSGAVSAHRGKLHARVTIEDVARVAEVSRQTVSRVLNDKDEVSEETRARVRAAIDALSYRPSAIARSLTLQRTLSIGLIVPDITNPYFPEIARGVEDACRLEGYHLFLYNTDENPEQEMAELHSLDENRVDGIVLVSSRLPDETLNAWLNMHKNVVLVNRWLPEGNTPAILIDDLAGAKIATQYLIQLGHRYIGFVMGPHHSYSVQQRLEGHRLALREANLEFQESLMAQEAPTLNGGYRAASTLLGLSSRPTALLATSDIMAAGALKACYEQGLIVPAEVSVMGHDDIPLAALFSPALTTMNIPKYEIGAKAAELLIRELSGEVLAGTKIIIEPKIIVRESTASPFIER